MARMMEISTPLGDDVLLFHRMTAREELGRLSEFTLDLLSKEETVVDFDKILGKNVTVKLELPDEGTRYFNGFVCRIGQGRKHGRYNRIFATVRPWTWFLTRTSDCRIFQNLTVPDILKKVFDDHEYANVKFDLTGNYRKWIYCVQYRETDFNFISRLMEHEGIYYYFKHEDGHHTMMLTDSVDKQSPVAGYEKIKFIEPTEFVRPEIEHIHYWDIAREVQPGKYVHTDYDFEKPSVGLQTLKPAPTRKHDVSKHEMFDYPGYYMEKNDGTNYAMVRIDEFSTQYEGASGLTNARGLAVGGLFTLDGCPRADQNCEHMVVSATYELAFSDYESMPEEEGPEFHCSFTALATAQEFRPRRSTPKPFVQGPQTAVVVGPGGEEIHTDKYGRVKVQFFWDREGKKDDGSSCWVRVSHPWAGKQWGAIAIPRIGQEVIVDFLEGDPDQPIITGRVYNAEQMPPYSLPDNKTQTGILTRSSMGGSPANANEFRFEDKKGSEQVYLHAEKNQDIEVENDETHWVGHDRTKTIDNDETVHVKRDRMETVDRDETLLVKHDRNRQVDNDENITVNRDRSETVHRNKTIQIDGNHSENIDGAMSVTIGKTLTENVLINYAETVGGAMEMTVGAVLAITVGARMAETIGGGKTEQIGGSKSESTGKDKTLTIGKDLTETVKGNQTVTIAKDLKETISGLHRVEVTKEAMLKAKKIQLTADDEISMKAGDASIILKKNGEITIKGGKITVKGSGDVIVKGSKIAEN